MIVRTTRDASGLSLGLTLTTRDTGRCLQSDKLVGSVSMYSSQRVMIMFAVTSRHSCIEAADGVDVRYNAFC